MEDLSLYIQRHLGYEWLCLACRRNDRQTELLIVMKRESVDEYCRKAWIAQAYTVFRAAFLIKLLIIFHSRKIYAKVNHYF